MKFFIILLIIVSTIFLFYCLYKMYQKKVLKEKNTLQKENYLQNLQQKVVNQEIDKELECKIIFQRSLILIIIMIIYSYETNKY